MELREARQRFDYKIVSKIIFSLESGNSLLKRCINLDARKQWTGLTQDKYKPFIKKLYIWGVTTHHHLPS